MKAAKGASEVEERGGKFGEGAGEALSKVGSWPQKSKAFLEDVRAETKRVTWPSLRQIQATTIVVIVTVFLFGAYFGILDWIFTRAVGWILQWGQ
ncbi:MAG: preprotein translocase subunit SecE [Acidobacteria bacterium]|nr:preprotein translocase subunit SecE [Acidobacteriota bacterium]